jgi:hypothetical protein
MNPPNSREDTVQGVPDEALRQSLKRALVQSDSSGLQPLQDRIVAQWAQRGATTNMVAVGPWGRLQLAWADRRMQLGAAALVVVMAVGLQLVRMQAEPNVDDILEPDVLALMAMGEL